jgi:hypothetical protein
MMLHVEVKQQSQPRLLFAWKWWSDGHVHGDGATIVRQDGPALIWSSGKNIYMGYSSQ